MPVSKPITLSAILDSMARKYFYKLTYKYSHLDELKSELYIKYVMDIKGHTEYTKAQVVYALENHAKDLVKKQIVWEDHNLYQKDIDDAVCSVPPNQEAVYDTGQDLAKLVKEVSEVIASLPEKDRVVLSLRLSLEFDVEMFGLTECIMPGETPVAAAERYGIGKYEYIHSLKRMRRVFAN